MIAIGLMHLSASKKAARQLGFKCHVNLMWLDLGLKLCEISLSKAFRLCIRVMFASAIKFNSSVQPAIHLDQNAKEGECRYLQSRSPIKGST